MKSLVESIYESMVIEAVDAKYPAYEFDGVTSICLSLDEFDKAKDEKYSFGEIHFAQSNYDKWSKQLKSNKRKKFYLHARPNGELWLGGTIEIKPADEKDLVGDMTLDDFVEKYKDEDK